MLNLKKWKIWRKKRERRRRSRVQIKNRVSIRRPSEKIQYWGLREKLIRLNLQELNSLDLLNK